ncbi:MAG: hypothetical protein HQ500_08545 [Flavobacteriales bacterium]|nr:hypothetical protein [Flavobacteriales bacterium]
MASIERIKNVYEILAIVFVGKVKEQFDIKKEEIVGVPRLIGNTYLSQQAPCAKAPRGS